MPLDYASMADSAGIRGTAADPIHSSDPSIRSIASTPWATYRPGEFESLSLLANNARSQSENRDKINTFYDDPMRQSEIDMAVQPQEQSAYLNLLNQIRTRSREEAFARARTGNIGGSVQADQQAATAGFAAQGGANVANTFASLRDQLRQALQAARVQEILKSYDLDPQLLASLKQRAATYGVADQGNALLEQLKTNQDKVSEANDDEYSRAWANALNVLNQQYQISQQRGMNQDAAAYNQRIGQVNP